MPLLVTNATVNSSSFWYIVLSSPSCLKSVEVENNSPSARGGGRGRAGNCGGSDGDEDDGLEKQAFRQTRNREPRKSALAHCNQ